MKRIILSNIKELRLSSCLKYYFPNLKDSIIYKALRQKDIRVNSNRITKDINVNNGDIIDIYINDNLLFNLPKNIKYIYEDCNIIVAYKPQGILSNTNLSNNIANTDNTIIEPTFEDLVKSDLKNTDIKICHRLDRNTGGLIIFSKNSETHTELLLGFSKNYIEKNYLAYVYNSKFNKSSDCLTAYLLKDSKSGYSKVYDYDIKNGKKILTDYTVIKVNNKLNIALLNVTIHTGRTHQIRAHLSYLGHPIIGDSKYGINSLNKKFKLFKQLLFAYRYDFNFPEHSYLNYLNNIHLKYDVEDYFEKLIGSENKNEL